MLCMHFNQRLKQTAIPSRHVPYVSVPAYQTVTELGRGASVCLTGCTDHPVCPAGTEKILTDSIPDLL